MSEAMHTPGPWMPDLDETTAEGGMPVRAIDPSDGLRFRVADVYGIDCDTHHCDVSKANARLIAAAPELLEVAKDFQEALQELGLFCECGEADCRTTRLRVAIAKATGQPHG